MDGNECSTVIPAARSAAGMTVEELLAGIDASGRQFGLNVKDRFGTSGEW